MANKTPDNRKASPMEHVHVRLPNLRNQIRAATDAGEDTVTVATEGEAEAVEIQTSSPKKGR